jgi:branched-chain amino acid aminotransferase
VQVAPIAAIDGRPVGEGENGPITERIREIFFDTVRGRNPKYAHFLTPVRAKVASGAD